MQIPVTHDISFSERTDVTITFKNEKISALNIRLKSRGIAKIMNKDLKKKRILCIFMNSNSLTFLHSFVTKCFLNIFIINLSD